MDGYHLGGLPHTQHYTNTILHDRVVESDLLALVFPLCEQPLFSESLPERERRGKGDERRVWQANLVCGVERETVPAVPRTNSLKGGGGLIRKQASVEYTTLH